MGSCRDGGLQYVPERYRLVDDGGGGGKCVMDLSYRSLAEPCRGDGDLFNRRGSVPSTRPQAFSVGDDCLGMSESDTIPRPCDAINPNGTSLPDLSRLVRENKDTTVEVD